MLGISILPVCLSVFGMLRQCSMDKVLRDIHHFSRAYIDDIVIYSCSWSYHIHHVRSVLTLLREAGLTVNPDKCRWGGALLKFLGHIVRNRSLAVPEERARAIEHYIQPKTKRGLNIIESSSRG